ncbi:MAG TPA: type I methionyl aminopeptidase [Bacilli bacterium]|nr:type I methionyl aminopeptidase [Bacilli bacterium]
MVGIKSKEEIAIMKKAGNIVYKTHQYLKEYIKPGVTTLELDSLAENYIRENDAEPSFKGYQGFPNAICVSINDEVVHGIPSDRKLKEGDLVSIDIGACYKGYHGDSAWSYPVGKVSEETLYLLKHTKQALYEGISRVKEGNTISDISKAIEEYAKSKKLGVIRELVGHGIGKNLHEQPDIPNYNTNDKLELKEGMTIAIEPMLNLGTRNIYIEDNDWTIKTYDSKASAHFEHTVCVTKDGCDILTGE